MTHLEALPLWAAILVAVFLVIGSSLTLIGTLGLVSLKSFYDRLHAPTLGTSWGTAGIIIASMVLFSVTGGRLILHEFLIGCFVMITTPVTLLLLGRAALHRDRVEGNDVLPERVRLPVVAEPEPPAPENDVADDAGASPDDAEEARLR